MFAELLLWAAPIMCWGRSRTVSHLSVTVIANFRGKEAEVREVDCPVQVELCPLKMPVLKSRPPGPQNGAALGRQADVISVRFSWGTAGPKSDRTRVLAKRTSLETDTQPGDMSTKQGSE